eukprot:scaffold30024_cov52-Cyclotella_meneghiniana.AAC.4
MMTCYGFNVRQALEIRRSRQSQTILRSNGNESSSRNASTPVNTIHQSRIIQAEKNNANINATVRRALDADNATDQTISNNRRLHLNNYYYNKKKPPSNC